MRILHTSDWHLGQNFYSRSRAPEHLAFFNWLKQQVIEHHIDAIVVAGDIFDIGSPPSYARQLLNQFIVDLHDTACQLYLLAGNHDSVATLNESRQLVACLNTHIIASVDDHIASSLFTLYDQQGKASALMCAIPYLRPQDIQTSQAGLSGTEKQQDLLQAISDYYQRHYQQAELLRRQMEQPDLPIIATGHLTALGVTKSDSVRDIYIGTLSAFPAQAFPAADYIALDHIHRAQSVGGHDHIRYSGSPLTLSFDELGNEKSVTLLEISDNHRLSWSTMTVPQFQPMQRLAGSLEQIAQQLPQLPAPPAGQTIWLDIEIHHFDYLGDLQQRIEALTVNLPVDILLLRRQRLKITDSLPALGKETLQELSVEEVFRRRLAHDQLDDAQQQRMLQLFRQIVASIDEVEE